MSQIEPSHLQSALFLQPALFAAVGVAWWHGGLQNGQISRLQDLAQAAKCALQNAVIRIAVLMIVVN
jgi:hypothetical protein